MSLPSLHREVLVRMGLHLLTLQSTEHAIRLCLQIVLPKEPIKTLDDLHSLEGRESKRTIGYFLTALRERTEIEPEFDKKLVAFLDTRNRFTHDLSVIQGWNMRTEEGCRTCIEMLERWEAYANEVQNTFAGLLRAWELQSGIETRVEGSEALITFIENDYIPKVPQVFGAKDA